MEKRQVEATKIRPKTSGPASRSSFCPSASGTSNRSRLTARKQDLNEKHSSCQCRTEDPPTQGDGPSCSTDLLGSGGPSHSKLQACRYVPRALMGNSPQKTAILNSIRSLAQADGRIIPDRRGDCHPIRNIQPDGIMRRLRVAASCGRLWIGHCRRHGHGQGAHECCSAGTKTG